MQIHQLKPNTPSKREKRVGRGDKTAGRGTKGQKARAGARIRPALRDMIKKLPKRRGYRFRSFRSRPTVVSLATVAERFPNGATVDPASLLAHHLIRKMKGRLPEVKILGGGQLQKSLTIRGLILSRSARASIEAAGGTIQ